MGFLFRVAEWFIQALNAKQSLFHIHAIPIPTWYSSVVRVMRIVFSPPPQHHLSRSATYVLRFVPCSSMYPDTRYSEHVSAISTLIPAAA